VRRVTVVVGIALAASVCGAAATAIASGKPAGTFNGCPTGVLPPASNAVEYAPTARRLALRFLRTNYARMNRSHHWGLKLAGATAGQVLLVRHWLPSGWIKRECGLEVWQRSVVVPIGLPAMEYPNPKGPCNSCARIAFLLAHTTGGWIVWGQY
jgi:hypothetical protein